MFMFSSWVLNLIIANNLTQPPAIWEIVRMIEIISHEFLQSNYQFRTEAIQYMFHLSSFLR